MGNEGPLLTCMEVEVVGAVWMDVVPGRLVTVNAGFRASCKRRDCHGSDQPRPCGLSPLAKPCPPQPAASTGSRARGAEKSCLHKHEESWRELSVNFGCGPRATEVP